MTADIFVSSLIAAALTVVVVVAGAIHWGILQSEAYRRALTKTLGSLSDSYEFQLEYAKKRLAEFKETVATLEVKHNGHAPKWAKGADGRIVMVSPEFVKTFGAPLGYRTTDFIGKRFHDLPEFPEVMLRTMDEMDRDAATSVYAVRNKVPVNASDTATLVKAAVKTNAGETLQIGYATLD